MTRRTRREDLIGRTIPLPSLSSLTADDEIYLQSMLAFAETGSMFRGRYAEAHVARLLGAVFPPFGISTWDLKVPGDPPILVEVKASQPTARYDLSRFKNGDDHVWVFVRFDTPVGARPFGFTYATAGPSTRRQLAGRVRSTISVNRLFKLLGEVTGDGLPAAVRSQASAGQRQE